MKYYLVDLSTGDKWGAFPSVGVAERKARLHGLDNIAIVDENNAVICGWRLGVKLEPKAE